MQARFRRSAEAAGRPANGLPFRAGDDVLDEHVRRQKLKLCRRAA
jgi:hypothetical protein